MARPKIPFRPPLRRNTEVDLSGMDDSQLRAVGAIPGAGKKRSGKGSNARKAHIAKALSAVNKERRAAKRSRRGR